MIKTDDLKIKNYYNYYKNNCQEKTTKSSGSYREKKKCQKKTRIKREKRIKAWLSVER